VKWAIYWNYHSELYIGLITVSYVLDILEWAICWTYQSERPQIWRVAANILKTVTDSRQRLVLQLGGWARGWQILTFKTYLVTKCSRRKPWAWTDTLDRDRWRALLNALMNIRVPQNAGNFLTSWKSINFSRRIFSMA
jgi:hypothetical protein